MLKSHDHCPLILSLSSRNNFRKEILEVIVQTENHVAAIEVETPAVSLHVSLVVLSVLITQETNVSNKAQVFVQIHSHTGFQTKLESIGVIAITIVVSITNGTIHEHIHHISVKESPTDIRIDRHYLVTAL